MAATSSEYNKYTVAQLRQLLKDNNLHVSGNKSDLVQRLEQYYQFTNSNTTITKTTTPKTTRKQKISKTLPIIEITDHIRSSIAKSMSIGYFKDVISALNKNMNIPNLNMEYSGPEDKITIKVKQGLAEGLANNTTIKKFSLSIDIDDLIAHGLNNNNSIKFLKIKSSQIKTLNNFIPQHLDNLELTVDSQTDNIFMDALTEHLKADLSIRKFTVIYANYDSSDDQIYKYLDKNKNITNLFLIFYDFVLPESFIQKILNSSIISLKIQYQNRELDTLMSLIKHLTFNEHIVEFDISSIYILDPENYDNSNLSLLFEQLISKNHTLEILKLRNNYFTNDVGYGIVRGLRKNRSIHTLDLGLNMFSEEIYVEFANMISNNESLGVVKLQLPLVVKDQSTHDSNITLDMVEKAFASALTTNQNLIELDIVNGKFTTPDIFIALQSNNTLERLNLSRSNFGNNVAIYISEMIKHNRSLRKIDISHGTHMSNDKIVNIIRSIQYNPNIVEFNIESSSNDFFLYEYATPYLQRNREQQRITNEPLINKLLSIL